MAAALSRCLATLLAVSARLATAQNVQAPCDWHVPNGDAQNVWDNSGILPGETELPCAGSLAYYEGVFSNTEDMCQSVFCPTCEYGHYCDLMCGFSLAPDEDLYDARMGPGACFDLISSGEFVCARDFCPTCGQDLLPAQSVSGYCDATCGFCTSLHDVFPGSECVEEFFVDWEIWHNAGCSPADGQAHCTDDCNSKMDTLLEVVEVDCEGHDLEQLPIRSNDPNGPQHVGHWLHGVVMADQLCNPHACSTLFLEANEQCLYGTGDDEFEFGCDTAGCLAARQDMATHQLNCTGDRDALLYHNLTFQSYSLWVEHECRLCNPSAIIQACSQQAADGTCHEECRAEVSDFVENRLDECREVMIGVGYDHSSIQTIEHLYSVCTGSSCVINLPENSYKSLDGDFPCEHTGVLHPGERCQILCDTGFDPQGDGIAECVGNGEVQLDLICHEQDCYQPIVFPPHVAPGDCDVHPLPGARPGEVEVHLARGESCQPICIDGYVPNGEVVACVPHPTAYGGALDHGFACHLPCDTSGVTQPRRGQLGTVCSGSGGVIAYGASCDMTCDDGFELSDQPTCQGHGDATYLSSDTATCTAIHPTAVVTSSMTLYMSISNAEEGGFGPAFKTMVSAEYSEFVGPTSSDRVEITSIELIGLNAVQVSYEIEVECSAGCDGGTSCLSAGTLAGSDCHPATSVEVDLRTIPANCHTSRCPLHVGPFRTVDPDLVEPMSTVEAQVTLDATMEDVNADRAAFETSFQESVALILGVAHFAIVITAIDPGSVVVTFTVATSSHDAAAVALALNHATIAGYDVLSQVQAAPAASSNTPAPTPAPPPLECSDNDEHCHSWAATGQCTDNFDYMRQECAMWCEPECEPQRPVLDPVPVQNPGVDAPVPETAEPAEEESGGALIFGVIFAMIVIFGGGAAFVVMSGRKAPKPRGGAEHEFDFPTDESPKSALEAEGHIKEDDHEDNPLADYDVEGVDSGEAEIADT